MAKKPTIMESIHDLLIGDGAPENKASKAKGPKKKAAKKTRTKAKTKGTNKAKAKKSKKTKKR